MHEIYRVRATEPISPLDPLHVGRFYPDTARFHARKMQDRQDLILYLAHIHAAATRPGLPYGFCTVDLRLTNLRDWVYDYKIVFDVFFQVVKEGYNFGDIHSISTVIPKKLPWDTVKERRLVYTPPPSPIVGSGTVSTVYPQKQNKASIMQNLAVKGRLDLNAAVEWILLHPKIEFVFQRSGKFQLRDTSVWPVAAVENWPAWLRTDLFGGGIDIDSAYTQFLIENITEAYGGNAEKIELMFPDLVALMKDKTRWRTELCVDVLGLEYTDTNISAIKRITMAMANGSRISPAIMQNGISVAKDIIIEKLSDTSPANLHKIGERLTQIARQFARARKLVCLKEGVNPTRLNQKNVFRSYFLWERDARYKIWERVGKHGIMVHDGIDGIPAEYLKNATKLMSGLNIRITAD